MFSLQNVNKMIGYLWGGREVSEVPGKGLACGSTRQLWPFLLLATELAVHICPCRPPPLHLWNELDIPYWLIGSQGRYLSWWGCILGPPSWGSVCCRVFLSWRTLLKTQPASFPFLASHSEGACWLCALNSPITWRVDMHNPCESHLPCSWMLYS